MLAVVEGREQAEAWRRKPLEGAEPLAVDAEAQAALESCRVPEEFYSPADCLPIRQDASARAAHLCAQLTEDARLARALGPEARKLLHEARFAEWRLKKTARPLAAYDSGSAWCSAARRLGAELLPFRAAAARAEPSGGMLGRVKESLSRGKAGLVLLGESESLRALGEEAARHGMPVRVLDPAALDGGETDEARWKNLRLGPELRDLVDEGHLETGTRRLAAELLPRAAALFERAAAWLGRHVVHAVVAEKPGWRERVVLEAARAAGVKTAAYETGALGFLRGDLAPDCDVLLAPGPAQKDLWPGRRVEAVGSPVLDRAFAQLGAPAPSEQPLYAYLAAEPDSHAWPQRRRPPSAALELRRRVGALFQGARARLELGAPSSKADAFIVDEPNEALLAAALTNRPIFYLDALADLDWLPEAREAVKSRCVFIESVEQLEAKLGARVATGKLSPNEDRWFVESYGVTKLDGESARRAWAALDQ